MIEGYTDVLKRALFDPREFQKLKDEDIDQLQLGLKDMATDINWQLGYGPNRGDADWKRRASSLQTKVNRQLSEINLAVKKRNIERGQHEDAIGLNDWKDMAHDMYDFILEHMGADTEVADWDIPKRGSDKSDPVSIHDWYLIREASLAKKAAA